MEVCRCCLAAVMPQKQQLKVSRFPRILSELQFCRGAALSFKYYQHCFSSMKESILVALGSGFFSRIMMIPIDLHN
ncbi:hypothetical protein CUMW_283720 [Citrus unshiu]|uniref:Uncharacterized protein n=1 Tax=Citrus unshiu TaxID=55188 RepID=A0A2H5MX58_CITUN|nr:hypothetical protein CUMW_283720 [Citrus unshiu]